MKPGVATPLDEEARSIGLLLKRCREELGRRWHDHRSHAGEVAGWAGPHHQAHRVALLADWLANHDPLHRTIFCATAGWGLSAPLQGGPIRCEISHASLVSLLQRDLDHVSAFAGLAPATADLLRRILPEPRPGDSAQQIRVLGIGDCIIGEIATFLDWDLAAQGIDLVFARAYLSYTQGRNLNVGDTVAAALEHGPLDLLGLSLFSYNGIPEYKAFRLASEQRDRGAVSSLLDRCALRVAEALESVRQQSDIPIVLHGAGGQPFAGSGSGERSPGPAPVSARPPIPEALAELNRLIADESRRWRNVVFLDELAVGEARGHDWLSQPVVAHDSASAIHFIRASVEYARSYLEVARDLVRFRKKKLIAVDLDNTLWRGVMAEGEVQHFRDRQDLLRRLREAGMLLVALSKNDAASIRWGELPGLAEADFVDLALDWNPKPHNLTRSLDRLNLGAEAVVFLDDRADERFLMSESFPKALVLDPDQAATWQSLQRLLLLPNTSDTQEARTRTELYRTQSRRAEALAEASRARDDLLPSLGIRIVSRFADPEDLPRIEELLARTNQFNITGRRYARTSLASLVPQILVFELSDRFGAMGMVGVAVVKATADEVLIDSLVMSCRAMGFGVEDVMMQAIARTFPAARIRGEFRPTDRNGPAADYFQSHGFVRASGYSWLGPADRGRLRQVPSWVSVDWLTDRTEGRGAGTPPSAPRKDPAGS
jgi:FkbH-like protein